MDINNKSSEQNLIEALAPAEGTKTYQQSNILAPIGGSPEEPAVTLATGAIYNLSYLTDKGYKFGRLAINRQLQSSVVKAKQKSIIAAGGVICPCLVVSARKCLDDGLSVVREDDGTLVTASAPDVDMILVIIDGQHRDKAVKELNEKVKKGEPHFECFYYLPLNPAPNIVDMLREANVATRSWKGGDYLTNLILTAPSNIDTEMLLWVQARYGTCGDVASWLWATLDPSRVYLKGTLVKASKSEDVMKKIADKLDFEFGKKLYEVAKAKLSMDLVKLKVVPLTMICLMKKITVTANKQEATDIICNFINSLTEEQVKVLLSFKRVGTLSKDQQIEEELMKYWKKFYQAN